MPCFESTLGHNHRGIDRRMFLADVGMGFTGLALGAMLHRDGVARADMASTWSPPDGQPHFAPKAKCVIWLFMVGGASHLETFDHKPALNKYAGKTIEETPHKDVLMNKFTDNLRLLIPDPMNGHVRHELYPLQVGFRKCGESGLEMCDWWRHLGGCADELAVVRSMWTNDNNHGAQLQWHTGRHILEGLNPTIGSWIHYGLGSLNDDLPQFVAMGKPLADCCGGTGGHGSSYLGPEHAGVQLDVDPTNALPFAAPGMGVYREEQQANFELLRDLNATSQIRYPEDPAMRARVKSYELAFRMQTAIPEVLDFADETAAMQSMYGLDRKETMTFGRQCLAARRLAERGVRFIQIIHGADGGAGSWDAHAGLKGGHEKLCTEVDKPIAGLIQDLKQRGMLDETLIVWGSEFGRTPGSQNSTGRDHHSYAFSIWMAGGGITGGKAHGATDELGYHAVDNRHYVTDVHATVLRQLGLDPRQLDIPGRKRLEIDYGKPILDILS